MLIRNKCINFNDSIRSSKVYSDICIYNICMHILHFISLCKCIKKNMRIALQFESHPRFESHFGMRDSRHNKLDLSQLNWTANVLNEQIKIK